MQCLRAWSAVETCDLFGSEAIINSEAINCTRLIAFPLLFVHYFDLKIVVHTRYHLFDREVWVVVGELEEGKNDTKKAITTDSYLSRGSQNSELNFPRGVLSLNSVSGVFKCFVGVDWYRTPPTWSTWAPPHLT